MNWSELHRESEVLADQAHSALRSLDIDAAHRFFREAAEKEMAALELLEEDKPRTFGIIAVSAASLWYKGHEFLMAERIAHAALSKGYMPGFAADQLRTLLQSVWNESAQKEAGVDFIPGQFVVSIKGGRVVRGGAPLDLIIEKANAVQNMFYRTVEYVRNIPLRRKGPISQYIQNNFQPWIFQSVPGSYQFSVAIQKPAQGELFADFGTNPEIMTEKFMNILRSTVEDPESLSDYVRDKDYRDLFMKMTKNLAPTGKTFTSLEIKSANDSCGVILIPESRRAINEQLGKENFVELKPGEEELVLRGVLRNLSLDRDWMEISMDGTNIKVSKVGEAVDDIIGPMVNHAVIVKVMRTAKGQHHFIDIERVETDGTESLVQTGHTTLD